VHNAKINTRPAVEILGRGHETEVLGTRITWGEMGEGEPLVLLHGIQDSHRTWRRVAPILALHFRVLMPDLPGHGYSGRPDAPYTLGWFADVVAEWMKTIGVPKAHVCGHSYGGGVAQWMLLDHRDRVDRLALVAAGGLGRRVGMGMQLATFPVLGRRLTPLALRLGLPLVLKRTTALFGHMEPEEVERTIRISRIPGTGRAFQRTAAGVINLFGQYVQTTQRVAEVGNMPPVALYWGTKDPIIPIGHGLSTVARSLGIKLTAYEGCGHFPHLDVPKRFSQELTDFLIDPYQQIGLLLPQTPFERLSELFRPW
jgi:pimeloyl-ACP methyl ester carboxylesterase